VDIKEQLDKKKQLEDLKDSIRVKQKDLDKIMV